MMDELFQQEQIEYFCSLIQSLDSPIETNCMISQNMLHEFLLENSYNFYMVFPEGLILLLDMGDYFSLQYFFCREFDISSRNIAIDLQGINKTVMLNIPCHKVRYAHSIKRINQWKDYGFVHSVTVEKMALNIERSTFAELPLGFSCIPATKSQKILAYSCFDDTFDSFSDLLVPLDLLLSEDSGHLIYVLTSEKDKEIGFLHFMNRGNYSELLHFYIIPSFRCQGYGEILMSGYLSILKSMKIKRTLLWVHSDNITAKHIYTQAGFLFDGKSVEKFIYQI